MTLKNDLKVGIFLCATCLSLNIWSMQGDFKKINIDSHNIGSFIKQHYSVLTATALTTGMLGLGYYWWQRRTPSTTPQTTQLVGSISVKQRLQNIFVTISAWANSINLYKYFTNKEKLNPKSIEKINLLKDNKQPIISDIVQSNKQVVESPQLSVLSFAQLVHNSAKFNEVTPFPTSENRIVNIAKDDKTKQAIIEKQAQQTRPIIHKKVIDLIEKFLTYKKKSGTRVEQELYVSMDKFIFIDRLLSKRPLMFVGQADTYLLRNGQKGSGGFEEIGTVTEYAPLILKEYLSYDEMQIAALIGVSTPTYFINSGSRRNIAHLDTSGRHQETGVYVGLVGARFEKDNRMESQHILITQKNMEPSKLLALWEEFYGEKFATFEQAQANKTERYIKLDTTKYFDTVVYKKRMHLTLEPFLIDANQRGLEADKKVYCHAVGLGLGVWQVTPAQAQLMLEVYADILSKNNFPNITDIDFSYFPANSKLVMDQGVKINQHIKIHFSSRDPAAELVSEDADKLLVAMYAWDGNAYPGNEYWHGSLSASGDPAAACCSTIAELQNPLINTNLTSKKLFIAG